MYFGNRKAISNFVQCLHSQLHVIRSFEIRFLFYFSFASHFHVNMDTIYDMDTTWELQMQQSSSWLYSWPTQFRRYFVFCQLTLKCKCWTIEAFVCSLFRNNIVLFFIVLRRFVWWQKSYTLLCIYTIYCYLDFWWSNE